MLVVSGQQTVGRLVCEIRIYIQLCHHTLMLLVLVLLEMVELFLVILDVLLFVDPLVDVVDELTDQSNPLTIDRCGFIIQFPIQSFCNEPHENTAVFIIDTHDMELSRRFDDIGNGQKLIMVASLTSMLCIKDSLP